jgi:hypothetical protein
MISNTSISISSKKDDPILSREQKQFNKLIKDIDKERAHLILWKDLIPKYQQVYANDFCPLIDEMRQLKSNFVKLLDQMHTSGRLTKPEKAKVSGIICSMIDDLIDPNDQNDLKEIYNKYTESDFDQEIEDETQIFKDIISSKFGVDLGDDFKMDSPEEVMAKLFSKMKQKVAQDEVKPKKNTRKPSARAIEKEKKLNQEAMEISQSIKDVYRKLVIFLHPDKEPDPVERERKTILTQRVNDAYTNRDLLKLLELQLEIEQIDQTSINSISFERLKTYNKILREQLNSIKQEVDGVQVGFRMRFDFPPGARLSPSTLISGLRCDINDLKNDITCLANDLECFKELKALKLWLKGYKNPPRSTFDDFVWVLQ